MSPFRGRRRAMATVGPLVVLLSLATPGHVDAGDPRAADEQYRVARRLVADRSPEAGAALARVVELDPTGPLADDALVEHAVLLGAPTWPDELGRLDADHAQKARSLFGQALRAHPGGDRAAEARYRNALLMLEPLPGWDPKRARVELVAVATSRDADPWAARARYAAGWIDAYFGDVDLARGAFSRVVIDLPATDAAMRARIDLALLAARAGEFGRAAAVLQEAIARGAPAVLRAPALRDAAVRALLRPSVAAARWAARPPFRAVVGAPKGVTAMAIGPDGSLLVGERKTGSVTMLDAEVRPLARWSLDDVRAVVFDPRGRAYGATDDQVVRLDPGGLSPVASLGDFSSPRALAVDGSGAIWVLDKKGSRLGRIAAGAATAERIRDIEGVRWSALASVGPRLLAAEERTGRLVAFEPDGGTSAVATGLGEAIASIATDAFGQVVVLDEDSGIVVLLGPGGEIRERLDTRSAGVDRPWSAGVEPTGALVVLDGAAGAAVKFR